MGKAKVKGGWKVQHAMETGKYGDLEYTVEKSKELHASFKNEAAEYDDGSASTPNTQRVNGSKDTTQSKRMVRLQKVLIANGLKPVMEDGYWWLKVLQRDKSNPVQDLENKTISYPDNHELWAWIGFEDGNLVAGTAEIYLLEDSASKMQDAAEYLIMWFNNRAKRGQIELLTKK